MAEYLHANSGILRKAFGNKLKDYLYITNLDALAPAIAREQKLKTRKAAEEKITNESINLGFKNLLSRML